MQLGAHKVGTCNVANRERRLTAHVKEGWQVVHTLSNAHRRPRPPRRAERSHRARRPRYRPYLTIELMPQGGYTETVDAEAIDIPALWRLITSVRASS